ncbi:Acetylcholinesterase [Dactylellina cionopaga]|nr:Acetylcholinesterase [Dactylellina cionopaga]
MMPKVTVLLSAICFLQRVASVAAVPALADLDTALTVLKEEDFWAQYSTKKASSILVESSKPFNAAQSVCSSLSEGLWSPEIQNFHAGVNSSLSYQVYLKKFSPTQLFWIAPQGNHKCRAIGVNGQTKDVDCKQKLPTLCTHSGALSNYTYQDPAPRYQITLPVGKQQLTGFRDAYGWRFNGIRYAPTPRRFEHSTVLDAQGSATALKFGDVCIQNSAWRGVPPSGSEDCLYLNVATPFLPGAKCEKKDLKPVLFWLHGGGYTENSGNIRNYDGIAMAMRGDIVVVKINYRLGNFGWLAIKNTSITGNYGLGDTINALKWVRANIAAFGGDPDRVTIGGESAGATSVRTLLGSEPAKGLFSASIIHSLPNGYYPTGRFSHFSTLEEVTEISGVGVLQDTGCIASPDRYRGPCLKNLPASTLNTIATVARLPVIDQKFISASDLPLNGKGGYMAHVPTMLGFNRDEAAIGILDGYTGDPSSTHDLLSYTDQINNFSLKGKKIRLSDFANHPAFPTPPGPGGAVNATVRISTNVNFKCGMMAISYSAAKHHTLPTVYTYEVNRSYQPVWWTDPLCVPPVTPGHPLGDPSKEYYKCHSGDLDFVLGILLYSGEEPRDQNDIPFEQLMVDRWSAFIWSNDPNPKKDYLKARNYWSTLNQVEKTGKWEQTNAREPTLHVLQWDGKQASFPEGPQCAALGLPLNLFD